MCFIAVDRRGVHARIFMPRKRPNQRQRWRLKQQQKNFWPSTERYVNFNRTLVLDSCKDGDFGACWLRARSLESLSVSGRLLLVQSFVVILLTKVYPRSPTHRRAALRWWSGTQATSLRPKERRVERTVARRTFPGAERRISSKEKSSRPRQDFPPAAALLLRACCVQ